MGDHNVDLLTTDSGSNTLLDINDVFDIKNIIQDTTCDVGDSKTLIDHIFTNKLRNCLAKGVLDNGINDVHRLIYTVFWVLSMPITLRLSIKDPLSTLMKIYSKLT